MDALEEEALRRLGTRASRELSLNARITRSSCVMMGDDANESSSQEKERENRSPSSQIGGCIAGCGHPIFDWRRLCGGGLRRHLAAHKRLRFILATAACRFGPRRTQARGIQDKENFSALACQSRARSRLC